MIPPPVPPGSDDPPARRGPPPPPRPIQRPGGRPPSGSPEGTIPPPARPHPPRPVGPDRAGDRAGERGRRAPAPVREGVEPGPRDPPQPIELPSRSIEVEGEGWVVREGGRLSAGVGRDTPAPLLHLVFARAADPERPALETLAPGRALDELSELELGDLLARARPYRERHERREVFPDTRRKGGKGM